jgi:hypothetical protein
MILEKLEWICKQKGRNVRRDKNYKRHLATHIVDPASPKTR